MILSGRNRVPHSNFANKLQHCSLSDRFFCPASLKQARFQPIRYPNFKAPHSPKPVFRNGHGVIESMPQSTPLFLI